MRAIEIQERGRGRGAAVEPASPVDVAELCLAVAAAHGTVAVALEPRPGGHALVVETPDGSRTLGEVPEPVGAAVVARVALVAGLDLAAVGERLGRVVTLVGGARVDLVLLVSRRPSGIGFELRRLVGVRDLAPPGGGGPVGSDLGAYRLLRELGRGGCGTVYEAEHAALGCRVAIKILHPEIAARPELATMLLREGRLASRAQSPGIVNVSDFGCTADGRPYLVMELVPWPTLAARLLAGALPPERAIAIAGQILAALRVAHEHGVTHRDLKPSNVFVGPGDVVKIGDFGTARLVSAAIEGGEGQAATVSGSPEYMSPEHAQGLPTDRRTDLYAVGCVLFEMLTGRVPYSGDTAVEIMARQVEASVPPVESPHGALPDVVVRTVRRALAKRAMDRYQDAAEMSADVARCAAALARRGWLRLLPA